MQKQSGFHLIDALISMLLFAIALISIDAMLLQTSRDIKALYYLEIGMQQLLQLHERVVNSGCSNTCLKQWNEQNQTLLPKGHGDIQHHDNMMRLLLSWRQGKQKTCSYSATDIHCLSIDIPHP